MHKNKKAVSAKIRKIKKEKRGLSHKAVVGRAFGILRGEHRKGRKKRK